MKIYFLNDPISSKDLHLRLIDTQKIKIEKLNRFEYL